MKKLSDEEIQKLLEQQLKEIKPASEEIENNEDWHTYQLLFESLEKEPSYQLSENFADHMVQVIGKKNERVETIRLVVTIAGCVVLTCLLSLITFYFVDKTIFTEAAHFITYSLKAVQLGHSITTINTIINTILRFKWLIIFCLAAFILIQTLDWWVIKKRYKLF